VPRVQLLYELVAHPTDLFKSFTLVKIKLIDLLEFSQFIAREVFT
jgi:hypothetical protein